MKAKSWYCNSARVVGLTLLALGLWLPGLGAAGEEGLTPPPAQSADSTATSLRGMDERVSLDLRSTDVTDALKFLATKGGLNIAISKNVSGRVNLFLTDVAIRDVFDLILRSNELAYDKQGNVFNIMTEAEYRALYGKKFADLRHVETLRLKYAVPEQAFNMLDALKSEVGRLLVDEDTGTVLILDTPEKLRQMEEALQTLEQSSTVRTFDLRYAKAKDVEERFKDEIELKKLGFIKADDRTNQLIVKTLPDRMKEIEQMILALDRKTREVLIDAKIVKVALNKEMQNGVDWSSVWSNLKFNGLDTVGDFRKTTTGTAPNETPAVTHIHLPEIKIEEFNKAGLTGKSINPGNLIFTTVNTTGYQLMKYLDTLGHTKIISNPRLMVTENQEARIHVGTREAYVTTTTTTGQTTTTTAEEVQFIDVGIQFVVTPTINADGFITMKIKPEISSVIRTLTTPSKNAIPIVDTSTAETSVMVKDGSTVIIGGLRKDENKRADTQLPYLGNLPLLGPLLFQNADHSSEVTELVVFITPHVVDGEKLVTGDELGSGGKLTSFRNYQPLLEPDAQGSGK